VTAGTTPARISVVWTPSTSAAGAVSANEIGASPTDVNQSTLRTRPSISPGTRVC
jgi:hypothetical protein